MSVVYNGNRIIPAPFISIQKSYIKGQDGHTLGATFNITVTGSIIACKGSPTSTGTFHTGAGFPADETIFADERLKSLLHKQDALHNLFADEGKAFEVQPIDNTAPIKFYPRIISLTFEEGLWVDSAKYTLQLETDELLGYPGQEDFNKSNDYFIDSVGNKVFLQSVAESWSLEFGDVPIGSESNEEHSFALTHNISAVGKHSYDSTGLITEGWRQARNWVNGRMGVNNDFLHSTSGLNLANTLVPYDHVRNENTDEEAGSYSIIESWLISNRNTTEDFTVQTNTTIDSNIASVDIQGNIQGLETRDSSDFATITESKWDSASTRFTAISGATIFNRAQSLSMLTLNILPLTSSIGKNQVNGTIDYSYQYDTRPSNCIAGALAEQINIRDTNVDKTVDIFASIAVPGRSAGPVLQDINTTSQQKRSIDISIVVPEVTGCVTADLIAGSPRSDVTSLINDFKSDLNDANSEPVFTEEDTDNWNPKTGQYTRNVTFVYQNCT